MPQITQASRPYTNYPWFYVQDFMNSAVIEDGIANIPTGVFAGCASLTSISIPASVTEIGNYPFADTNLTDVTVEWATPLDVPVPNDLYFPAATLHVPSGTKALYEAHPAWGQFGTIDGG
jgi:hypothetical protein